MFKTPDYLPNILAEIAILRALYSAISITQKPRDKLHGLFKGVIDNRAQPPTNPWLPRVQLYHPHVVDPLHTIDQLPQPQGSTAAIEPDLLNDHVAPPALQNGASSAIQPGLTLIPGAPLISNTAGTLQQGTKKATDSLTKGLAPFLPFLPFAEKLKTQTKDIYNVGLELVAKSESKIYQFTLGSRTRSRTFAIEIEAGKPLQFSQAVPGTKTDLPPVLYPDRFTTLIVNILDFSSNPELESGPKIYSTSLSAKEGLLVIHRNPMYSGLQAGQPGIERDNAETATWGRVRSLFLKFDDAKEEQSFPLLPFEVTDPNEATSDTFEIWQRPSPKIIEI